MAEYTEAQNAAFNAGIGYGAAKSGKRVPVRDENKDSFRNGVQKGKHLTDKSRLATTKPTSAAASKAENSDSDKLKYYSGRVNDMSLSKRQRSWAAKRVSELKHK